VTNTFTFEAATKDQAKARIALAGPAGSGKTWTALTLATAFGGTIAVIDTERGSASKYAGPFKFQRLNLTRYDPHDVPAILAEAAAQGFGTIIIDSLSRFWSGAGGMLEQVDNSARRGALGGNQFGGWKEQRPVEAAMIEAMLGYPGHVIVTMRVKTAYEVTTDDRGKKVPVKIGLAPEQRQGIEYEFDVVGDMDIENTLTISKTRCPALAGAVIRRPDRTVGTTILEWLSEGTEVPDANTYRDQALTEHDPVKLRELWAQVRQSGLYGAAVIDEHGDSTTLGELVGRKGREAIPARPPDQLPRNTDGSISRSRTTDAEKEAAGLMTDAQRQEHSALGGGHPGARKTNKNDRAKVARIDPDIPPENRPGSISPQKLRHVQALFSRWFTEDERDERLLAAEKILNRELTGPKDGRSFGNLTLAEAATLLADPWARLKTRDDLIARLAEAVST